MKMTEGDAKKEAGKLTNRLYTIYFSFVLVSYFAVDLIWPHLVAWGAPGNIYKAFLVFFAFLALYNLRFVSKLRFERDRLRVMAGEVPEEHHHTH